MQNNTLKEIEKCYGVITETPFSKKRGFVFYEKDHEKDNTSDFGRPYYEGKDSVMREIENINEVVEKIYNEIKGIGILWILLSIIIIELGIIIFLLIVK